MPNITKNTYIGLGLIGGLSAIAYVGEREESNDEKLHDIHIAGGLGNIIGIGGAGVVSALNFAVTKQVKFSMLLAELGTIAGGTAVGTAITHSSTFGNEMFFRLSAEVVGGRLASHLAHPLIEMIPKTTALGKLSALAADIGVSAAGSLPFSYVAGRIARAKRVSAQPYVEAMADQLHIDTNDQEPYSPAYTHQDKTVVAKRKSPIQHQDKTKVRNRVKVNEDKTSSSEFDKMSNRKIRFGRAF